MKTNKLKDLISDIVREEVDKKLKEAKSGGKDAYEKFFEKTLKKYNVSSPDELSDEKKKEFFNYIDKNWDADNETD